MLCRSSLNQLSLNRLVLLRHVPLQFRAWVLRACVPRPDPRQHQHQLDTDSKRQHAKMSRRPSPDASDQMHSCVEDHDTALTRTWPSAKRSSTSVRSVRDMPAWWQAMPYGRRSFSAAFFVVSASVCRISRLSDVSCAREGSVVAEPTALSISHRMAIGSEEAHAPC